MDEKFNIKIRLMDGESLNFELTPERGTEWTRGSKIQQLFSSNMLALELPRKIMIIPTSTIRSIEISPIPTGLAGVIKNLKQLD